MSTADKLTQKEELYCRKRVQCGNHADAYRFAYPTSRAWKDQSVHTKAWELEQKPKIKVRIKELIDAQAKELGLDVNWVLEKLKKIVETILAEVAVKLPVIRKPERSPRPRNLSSNPWPRRKPSA